MKNSETRLSALVAALMDHGMIAPEEMQALMAAQGLALAVPQATGSAEDALVLEPFAERLAQFQRAGAAA